MRDGNHQGTGADGLSWGVVALLFSLVLALVHGAGGMPFFRDRLYYFLPQFEACRRALAAGEVPLWNPFVNCGSPLLATWQVGLLSPFSSPFLLLPYAHAVRLFWAAALATAAAGTFALGLRAGLTPFGSAVAAVVYAGAGPLRSLGEWPNIVAGAALLPGLLAALADLSRGRRGALPVTVLLGACVILAGQPRQVLVTGLACAAWLVALRLRGPAANRGTRNTGMTAAIGLAILGAAAVSAAQLLPSAGLFARSDRLATGIPDSTVLESFLDPRDLLTAACAGLFGNENASFGPGRLLVPRLYLGFLGLALALRGIRSLPGAASLFAAISIPAGLALALAVPLYPALAILPGAGLFRYMGHFILAALPAVALAAGRGAEVMRREGRGPGWAWSLIPFAFALLMASPAGPAAFAAAMAPGASFMARSPGHVHALAAGFAVAAGAALVARFAAAGRGSAGAIALMAVLALDLGFALRDHEAKAPPDAFPPPSILGRHALVRGRAFIPGWTVPVIPEEAPDAMIERYRARYRMLSPNTSLLFGIRNTFGYEPFHLAALRELLGDWETDPAGARDGLALSGSRWAIVPPGRAIPGWRRAELLQGGWELLSNPAPRPVEFVIDADHAAGPWRGLLTAPSAGRAMPRKTGAVHAGWTRFGLSVVADRPALLVPGILDPSGWVATVGGIRAPVGTAGKIMAAVPVPPGRSVVEMTYRPFPFGAGLLLSTSVVAALLAGVLLTALPPPARKRNAPRRG